MDNFSTSQYIPHQNFFNTNVFKLFCLTLFTKSFLLVIKMINNNYIFDPKIYFTNIFHNLNKIKYFYNNLSSPIIILILLYCIK